MLVYLPHRLNGERNFGLLNEIPSLGNCRRCSKRQSLSNYVLIWLCVWAVAKNPNSKIFNCTCWTTIPLLADVKKVLLFVEKSVSHAWDLRKEKTNYSSRSHFALSPTDPNPNRNVWSLILRYNVTKPVVNPRSNVLFSGRLLTAWDLRVESPNACSWVYNRLTFI